MSTRMRIKVDKNRKVQQVLYHLYFYYFVHFESQTHTILDYWPQAINLHLYFLIK